MNVVTGDIFEIFETTAAVVNPVNCSGVMGKGLALAFKERYPQMFKQYALDCRRGYVKVGFMHIYQLRGSGKWIVNFPTKHDWRNPSRLEWIVSGLDNLVRFCDLYEIPSIVIPALGCSNGGLQLTDVQPLIAEASTQMLRTNVTLVLNE